MKHKCQWLVLTLILLVLMQSLNAWTGYDKITGTFVDISPKSMTQLKSQITSKAYRDCNKNKKCLEKVLSVLLYFDQALGEFRYGYVNDVKIKGKKVIEIMLFDNVTSIIRTFKLKS